LVPEAPRLRPAPLPAHVGVGGVAAPDLDRHQPKGPPRAAQGLHLGRVPLADPLGERLPVEVHASLRQGLYEKRADSPRGPPAGGTISDPVTPTGARPCAPACPWGGSASTAR